MRLTSHQSRSRLRWEGPRVGGYELGKSDDSSQARTATRFDVAPVRVVQKTLRSSMELRILYRTTFSDSSFDVMCSLQVEKSEQLLHVGARPTSTCMTA